MYQLTIPHFVYRPGQPNWKCIKWKFQDFPATQILREINLAHFAAQKTAILIILAALNIEFLGIGHWYHNTLKLRFRYDSVGVSC